MSARLYPGDRVRDTSTNQIGIIIEIVGREIILQPLLGGKEWTVDRRHIEPATRSQELLAKVRTRNERSRPQW